MSKSINVKTVRGSLRWILAAWIAFVFVQSLFFKFSNAPETQYIFGVLGGWSGLVWFAQYGAYGVGSAELIASILLLTRWWPWGAVFALCIMSGALFFHLFTPLGVFMPVFAEGVKTGETDGGMLFIMACLTWLSAMILILGDWLSSDSQIKRLLLQKSD